MGPGSFGHRSGLGFSACLDSCTLIAFLSLNDRLVATVLMTRSVLSSCGRGLAWHPKETVDVPTHILSTYVISELTGPTCNHQHLHSHLPTGFLWKQEPTLARCIASQKGWGADVHLSSSLQPITKRKSNIISTEVLKM